MEVTWKKWEIFKAEESAEIMGMRKLKNKVSYALQKNVRVVQQEARDLRSIKDLRKNDDLEWNKQLAKYQRRANAISLECSIKNEKGHPVQRNDGGYMPEDPGQFEVLMTALDEEFPEVVEARDESILEYDRMLEEDITLTLHSIKFGLLPEEFPLKALGPFVEIITGVPTDEEYEAEEELKKAEAEEEKTLEAVPETVDKEKKAG